MLANCASQPPTAANRPSGEIAAAAALPPFPGPTGTRSVASGRPSGSDQSRAVLSTDPVTATRHARSASMPDRAATCMPVSMRNCGSCDGQAAIAAVRAALGCPSTGPA